MLDQGYSVFRLKWGEWGETKPTTKQRFLLQAVRGEPLRLCSGQACRTMNGPVRQACPEFIEGLTAGFDRPVLPQKLTFFEKVSFFSQAL